MSQHLHNNDPGLWCKRTSGVDVAGRPALFLDRDGVLVEEVNYLHRVEDSRLIAGAAACVLAANDAGLAVVLVTNQAGVGRGYYEWDAFAAVQADLLARLDQQGARVDMVLACAYHEDGVPPYAMADHAWRKPNTGMIDTAAAQLGLNLDKSCLVGDAVSDIETARNAGLAKAVHVLTGHGARDRPSVQALDMDGTALECVDSIADVAAALRD